MFGYFRKNETRNFGVSEKIVIRIENLKLLLCNCDQKNYLFEVFVVIMNIKIK